MYIKFKTVRLQNIYLYIYTNIHITDVRPLFNGGQDDNLTSGNHMCICVLVCICLYIYKDMFMYDLHI
jgi:hypothetical protein